MRLLNASKKNLAIAAFAGIMAGTGLFAQAEEATVKIKIDLQKLETEKGAAQVYKQLKRQSKRICAGPGGIRYGHLQDMDCVNEQLGYFIGGIDNPNLTALHAASDSRWNSDANQNKPAIAQHQTRQTDTLISEDGMSH